MNEINLDDVEIDDQTLSPEQDRKINEALSDVKEKIKGKNDNPSED